MEALLSLLGNAEAPKRPKTPLEEALMKMIFGEGSDLYQSLLPGAVNTDSGFTPPSIPGVPAGGRAL